MKAANSTLATDEIRGQQLQRTFSPSLLALCAIFVGLLFGLTSYTTFDDKPAEQIGQYYQWFIHVNIMVFIGFGFLMTFLRRYSIGAVSLNMVASAVMFVEALLFIGATQQVFWNKKANMIHIDIPLLIDAAFCAASGMIAFGAVIGKVTPAQLMWLTFAQVPIYAVNQHLVIHTFKALDMGGTLVIHLFGAYYGLAASLMLSKRQSNYGLDHSKNRSSYLNDTFSMIGTLFLWIYWPSFNGALASIPLDHSEPANEAQRFSQFLCVVNTILSLLGSTISTFAISAFVGRGRINMVHIQNSTLAGAVAMGAACTLQMTPGGAIIVGMAAGALSVCGFTYLTPLLDSKIRLGDTCGIHNLHGMPAILGGLVAGLASLGQNTDYLMHETGGLQLGNQVAAMVVTMALAIAGGTLVGYVLRVLNPTGAPELQHAELFDDGVWWEGLQVEHMPYPSVHGDASKHSGYSVHRAEPVHRPASVVSHHVAIKEEQQQQHGQFLQGPAALAISSIVVALNSADASPV